MKDLILQVKDLVKFRDELKRFPKLCKEWEGGLIFNIPHSKVIYLGNTSVATVRIPDEELALLSKFSSIKILGEVVEHSINWEASCEEIYSQYLPNEEDVPYLIY